MLCRTPDLRSPLSQGPGEASKAGERRSKWIRRNTTHRNDETMLFVKDSFGWGARNGCWLDKVKSPASILFFITMNTLLRRMIHYIYVMYCAIIAKPSKLISCDTFCQMNFGWTILLQLQLANSICCLSDQMTFGRTGVERPFQLVLQSDGSKTYSKYKQNLGLTRAKPPGTC